MLIGHYSPAFAIKAIRPQIPLWLLFVAVQFLDIVWGMLILLGIEKVRIIRGFTGSNPLDLYFMPYTHSLLAAGFWTVGALLAYRALPYRRPWPLAGFVALAVFSHWPLDVIVHVRDLPIYGDHDKIGLGLWNHPALGLLLELAPVLAAAWYMHRRTASPNGKQALRMGVFCLILTVIQLYSLFGPIPATPRSLAMTTLSLYGIVTFLAWVADSGRIEIKVPQRRVDS